MSRNLFELFIVVLSISTVTTPFAAYYLVKRFLPLKGAWLTLATVIGTLLLVFMLIGTIISVVFSGDMTSPDA